MPLHKFILCLQNLLQANSKCINTVASYECVCDDGFKWGNAMCLDIDECYSGDHGCSDNSQCSNTDGSYECTCAIGYEATKAVGGSGLAKGAVGCADIDECIDDNYNQCNEHADCINNPGSYSCECRTGFHGTGFDESSTTSSATIVPGRVRNVKNVHTPDHVSHPYSRLL